MSTIGFVGLGAMGSRISRRLLDAGHDLYGTDRAEAKAKLLIERGLQWLDTPREVAAAAEVVFSMVTDDAAVRAITSGSNGILAGLQAGQVYVDMSTISPHASREVAQQVRAVGAQMLDAPVSGSIPQAESGTLAIMVGGDPQAFAAAERLLRELGQTVTHIGPNGQGLVLKLAINISLAVTDLFAAVTEEVGQLLAVEYAFMGRYEPDGTLVVVGAWGTAADHAPVGSRRTLGGNNLVTIVFETGRPARIDNYDDATGPLGLAARDTGVRSAVATPILVEDRLWGIVVAGSRAEQPLPADSEARNGSFTELVATAIANAESRSGLARLAEEQAALRRVATLVARAVPPEQVFEAVAAEVERLLPVDFAHMGRYEPDRTVTVVATTGTTADHFPVGRRWKLGGKNLTTIVFETGRSARIDGYPDASGPLGVAGRELGIYSSAGTPIIVEGHVWGVVTAGTTVEQLLPPGTEARLGSFTELVATAIANAENRAALAASRARIVAAADKSRRRIERDLHDGAQQRLVHAVIVLKLALRALAIGDPGGGELVAEALRHTEQANAELRELAHGILPAALTRGGLRAGVDALVSRVSLPVSVDVEVERLPAGVEATAYFVVSEALTNVVKHARAAHAGVSARLERGQLRVEISDDGVGGARAGHGTGLGGLEDRVSALDGRVMVDSPPGGGTRLCALLPLSDGS